MASSTKIEWCDATWNPVTGCTPISEGCQNCWAKRMSKRLAGPNGYPADDPFRVTFHPDRLEEPLRWRKPKRIAVSLMGDLFHDGVAEEWVWKVVDVCYRCPQHTFLFLTKRPKRMYDVLSRSWWWVNDTPKNIWLGTSVENQKAADERIPWLLKCPAAVRFLSMEPLLGHVDLYNEQRDWIGPIGRRNAPPVCRGIDWVIVGGESGHGARPMHPEWGRSIRDQCLAAKVPFFFKQWGNWGPMVESSRGLVCSGNGSLARAIGIDGADSNATNGPYALMGHVDKKTAGRLLDGREWNELPRVSELGRDT